MACIEYDENQLFDIELKNLNNDHVKFLLALIRQQKNEIDDLKCDLGRLETINVWGEDEW